MSGLRRSGSDRVCPNGWLRRRIRGRPGTEYWSEHQHNLFPSRFRNCPGSRLSPARSEVFRSPEREYFATSECKFRSGFVVAVQLLELWFDWQPELQMVEVRTVGEFGNGAKKRRARLYGVSAW
jgi:hypothetical protein